MSLVPATAAEPPPRREPPPAREAVRHVPADAFDRLLAGRGLTDGGASAEIFNEHGLMGRAISANPSPAPVVGQADPAPSGTAAATLAPTTENQQGPVLPMPQNGLPSARHLAANDKVRAATTLVVRRSASQGIASAAPRPPALETDSAGLPLRAQASGRMAWAQQCGRTNPVAVAISSGETGLRLAARIGRLSSNERARLRDELAALIRQHGWPLETLALFGPVTENG